MTLARAWTHQLYGAWGVALLAPVTMIAALVVLAIGGGFGGLGALGQLVSGPAVPVGSSAAGGASIGQAKHRTTPLVLAVVPAPSATARTRAPATSPAGAVRPGAGGSPGGGGTVQRVTPRGGHGAPGPTRIAPPGKLPTPTPTPAPTPSPTPAPPVAPLPALVNQVVAVGESVTSKLPGPVGALGSGVLQSLGQTLDQLLTPPA
ncbi:MAG: hypothetical protein QOJ25_648 [Solirubrobacteraceae bacterium]|jgi:hypothetical protein|nr:hypothetical protein [Solirubrobacteraceae bacterium]